jgi:hypothetical protein
MRKCLIITSSPCSNQPSTVLEVSIGSEIREFYQLKNRNRGAIGVKTGKIVVLPGF